MEQQPSAVDLLESLTETQRQAVQHVDGPLIVLAGPGSGKTRVVTHRIAYLLQQGIAARQILGLTFTNKAAEEMRARIQKLVPGESVWMCTFHRFCARMLREHARYVGLEENYSIYDTNDSLDVIKRVIEEQQVELVRTSPRRIAQEISRAKNNLITAENYESRPGDRLGNLVAQIYPDYQKNLINSNAVDFDDLLLHLASLLNENHDLRARLDDTFRYVLVDEYQDTNLAQYAIARALSIDHPHLCVTGDPDQSIYSWRGANLSNILEFEKDFENVQVVRLEQNYRSTKKILRVADALIARNTQRKEKVLFTENVEGSAVKLTAYADQRDEAESIASNLASQIRSGQRRARDFAIFYRVNALSRVLEQALYEQGVPYQIVSGVEFYQRQEIKDVLAYLHLINNPRNDVALQRVINRPSRGIGKVTLNRLAGHATRYGLSMLEAARQTHLLQSLSRRAAKAVSDFVRLMDHLQGVADAPLEELLGHVITESGYEAHLQSSGASVDEERLDNIGELLSAARQFDESNFEGTALDAFLERVSLVSDTDAFDVEPDQVTLMTLHAAKGLEFPVIFITAIEEGILPHQRNKEELHLLEEERRLLFVGITRAQEELHLSMATYRDFRGSRRPAVPSSFLVELPRQEIELIRSEEASVASTSYVESYEEIPAYSQRPSADVPATRVSSNSGLITAADMLKRDTGAEPVTRHPSPEDFVVGMMVAHPEYQLGKVVALHGQGDKRTATIHFFAESSQKKFQIAKSNLRPIGKSEE